MQPEEPAALSSLGHDRDEQEQASSDSLKVDGSSCGWGSDGGRVGVGTGPMRSSPSSRDSYDSSSSGRGTPRAFYKCRPRHGQGSGAVADAASALHSQPPSADTAEEILLTVSCKGVDLAVQLPPPPHPKVPAPAPPASAPASASASASAALDDVKVGVGNGSALRGPSSSLARAQERGLPPPLSLDGSQPITNHASGYDPRRRVGTSPGLHSTFQSLALASVPVPPPVVLAHPYAEAAPVQGDNVLAKVMLHLDWDDITAWGYNLTSLRVQYSRRKARGCSLILFLHPLTHLLSNTLRHSL